jgi:poly(A) polymerase
MDPVDAIRQIATAFTAAGFEIYEVGGSVRGRLLNRAPVDFDLTTSARPDTTESILRGLAIGAVYTIGKAYGTIGMAGDGFTVEITTFRGEVYPTGSRKPIVVFGNSLRDDLARRDFTIGAIARNPLDETIVDPFGGIADLNARTIRLVGGTGRFAEDPLRMMRAIRFAVQLDFALAVEMPDPARLAIISHERIFAELQKILLSPSPHRGMGLLRTFGLMPYVIPEVVDLYDVEQGIYHYADVYRHTLEVVERAGKYDGADKIVIMLAALLHDIGKPQTRTVAGGDVHFYGHAGVGAGMAEKILTRLHCDRDTLLRVVNLVAMHMTPVEYPVSGAISRRTVLRLVRQAGERDARMLIALARADTSSTRHPRTEFLSSLEAMVIEAIKEKPSEISSPLSGEEIMARFALPPSPKIGRIKEHLVGLVIDGGLARYDREAALIEVARFLSEGGGPASART